MHDQALTNLIVYVMISQKLYTKVALASMLQWILGRLVFFFKLI